MRFDCDTAVLHGEIRLTLANFGDEKAHGNAEHEESDRVKDRFDVIDLSLLQIVSIGSTMATEWTDHPEFHQTELQ